MKGCFLIGSGPSLNRIDVTRLRDYCTLAFNRSHLAWDAWGFHPTYYARLDPKGLKKSIQEVRDLLVTSRVQHFFLHESAQQLGIESSPKVTHVKMLSGDTFFAQTQMGSDFGNVGASSLQILAGLGYQRIVMVGVDGYYPSLDTKVSASVVYQKADPDHFHPDYASPTSRVSSLSAETVLGRWPKVAQACKDRNIQVRLASPGSALTCFETIPFEDTLRWIGPLDQKD